MTRKEPPAQNTWLSRVRQNFSKKLIIGENIAETQKKNGFFSVIDPNLFKKGPPFLGQKQEGLVEYYNLLQYS